MLTALTSPFVNAALFVEATFQTGPVYLWSGYGPITWNGHTWVGIGSMGSVSIIEEGSTVEAKGLTLTLSGFDSTLLPDVLNEFSLLLPIFVWLGCFNGGSLIANPILCFSGRMDQPELVVDGATSTLTINCESRLLDLNVATDRRYTADDCQRDFPGDLGFNFVNQISEITINWGQATTTNNI